MIADDDDDESDTESADEDVIQVDKTKKLAKSLTESSQPKPTAANGAQSRADAAATLLQNTRLADYDCILLCIPDVC